MTDLESLHLQPTHGDFLLPGDLLYDGPHRGVVVRWYPTEKLGKTPHFTHYDIVTDGVVYRVALRSEDQYQVVRGFVDVLNVLDDGTPVLRVP